MPRRRTLASLAMPLLAVAALTGCGDGAGSSADTGAAPAPSTSSAGSATIALASAGDLGRVLVDRTGRTLYLFEADSQGKSACFGGCAEEWPPLRAAGKPLAGTGAEAALVGTIERSDGRPQVTYAGHPLYLFAGDTAAGDTSGEGVDAFGGRWYAVSAQGDAVHGSPSSSASGVPGY